ncbi:SDR family oxidoreductase [Arachidicoccus ginsenosidivorans]|uniref:SDR family oxidoreductase n=1 Tax=Arachidicoccus ginsenosidivorans TaxID=496057 RepID=A0A5B8VPT7_9BACT|nr:SDR family oxidoreductase [Arachidicoccus ginsenosidivorans]QEC73637.1 SDR family oxidoreductase [Arachidicoccus ginsenosidivorans]
MPKDLKKNTSKVIPKPKKDRFQTEQQQTKSPKVSHKVEQEAEKKADQKKKEKSPGFPAQHQKKQPGSEDEMEPEPLSTPIAAPARLLEGKTVIITGGDSGIGKAVALLFASHGANICVVYLNENTDAAKTQQQIEDLGAKSLFLSGDITDQSFCKSAVEQALSHFSGIDILINNAGVQYPKDNPEDITSEQLIKTFSTNVFAAFYFVTAALPYLKKGSCIINTTSVTAYRGSKSLVDYAATKGALVAFTRSLSSALIKRQIRVNAVAPGPIWTPLIVASFSKEKVSKFGTDVPMGRAGQPQEVAPCYLFLATDQSSYMTGQVLHPNGGEIVGG